MSRRALLLSSAAAAACNRPKAQRFLGYCFVANRDGHTIGVVDLTRFRTRQQIPLDAAPTQVLARPKTTKAYVLAPAGGTVYEIDAGLLTITRRVSAGNAAISMRISRMAMRSGCSIATLPASSKSRSIPCVPAAASVWPPRPPISI